MSDLTLSPLVALARVAGSVLLVLCAASALAAEPAAARRALTPDDLYRVLDISDPQVSPDGSMVAYVSGDGAKQFNNVFIVSAEGGAPRQVSWLSNSNGGGLSWSADGTFLTLASGQRTEDGQKRKGRGHGAPLVVTKGSA